ncbi:MAG: hypothetical protein KAI76_07495 [Alphaproteobacteria bacterium]|nr:hypothetical protein [Alphaproteobacteria bacterium]
MEKDKNIIDYKKLCITLYGVYALSAVLQFFFETVLLGIIALVIAYILTAVNRARAKDTIYDSHFQWLSRTFWIGGGVIVPAAAVIAAILIWNLTDIAFLASSMRGDDPAAMMSGIQSYMDNNMTKVSLITMATIVPTAIWWIRRCWVGYVLVKVGKPVENVKSWL